MRYFLKRTKPSKKGEYLQIYESSYIPGKGGRNRSYKAIGYVSDLLEKGIKDPIKYAQNLVNELNDSIPSKSEEKICDESSLMNIGYFLIKSMIDFLAPDEILNLISRNNKFTFNLSDTLRLLIYTSIINSDSVGKTCKKSLSSLYDVEKCSIEQLFDTVNLIGRDYEKFIELFNMQISKRWKRNSSNIFSSSKKYFLAIDLPEINSNVFTVNQTILFDEDRLPIAMNLNIKKSSENDKNQSITENLMQRFDVGGRVIQIGKRGLDCSRSIYDAIKNENSGYIFSKSVSGHNLSTAEKEWILNDDNESNKWHDVLDRNGNVIYRYKELVAPFDYSFIDENGETTSLQVKEKRFVIFNSQLAHEQEEIIQHEVSKARYLISCKDINNEEFVESHKYIKVTSEDSPSNLSIFDLSIDENKIKDDLSFAGYTIYVSSECDKSATELYDAFKFVEQLNKSFYALNDYLGEIEVQPKNIDTIYGYYTINYLAFTILRLLELKVFNEKLDKDQIVEFIKELNITKTYNGSFINTSTTSKALGIVKKRYSLPKLDNLYLDKKSVDNIINAKIIFD